MTGRPTDLPTMFDLPCSTVGRSGTAVLVTLVQIAGSSPRHAGTQMLFWDDGAAGYLSGGCVELDLANHAAEVVRSGTAKRLVYGRGSPWIDIRLECGGTIEVLLERVNPDDCRGFIDGRGAAKASDLVQRRAVAFVGANIE